jgi:pilus assembly protein CpaF
VDIVVHVARLHSGERRVARIAEVTALQDGEYQIHDIFVYRPAAENSDGSTAGTFHATGYVPQAMQRLAEAGMDIKRYAALFAARQLERKSTRDSQES